MLRAKASDTVLVEVPAPESQVVKLLQDAPLSTQFGWTAVFGEVDLKAQLLDSQQDILAKHLRQGIPFPTLDVKLEVVYDLLKYWKRYWSLHVPFTSVCHELHFKFCTTAVPLLIGPLQWETPSLGRLTGQGWFLWWEITASVWQKSGQIKVDYFTSIFVKIKARISWQSGPVALVQELRSPRYTIKGQELIGKQFLISWE